MSQKEWLELFTEFFSANPSETDYLMLIITTISSLGVVVTGIFTFLAARSARAAVKTSIDIYADDKKERELLLMPIFEIQNANFGFDTRFELININKQHPVSITSFGINTGGNEFKTERHSDNMVKMTLENYQMKEQQSIIISLYYTALNHRMYMTKLTARRDSKTIFIDNMETKQIER